jgi:FixJ family two-component response regulator
MPAVVTKAKSQVANKPRVLIVDDEPELIELVRDMVVRNVDCRVVVASSLKEAKKMMASESVEVLVTDVHLPDGDGMSLLAALHDRQPTSSAIVITGKPSVDGAISALRGGAVDFVPKPFSATQIIERVRLAIERQADAFKRERRVDRLRDAVRRLNESRKMISKKVDLLCNDLVGAYGELSGQMDVLRYEEGFRKHVHGAEDLEQYLCHAMDWLLRKVGYSNVAVYLAADDGAFQLGAYMKYTIAGEAVVTDAAKRVLVPMAAKSTLIHLSGKELTDRMTSKEIEQFKATDILGVNCTYLGESLASLIFFRDERAPFTEDDVKLLKQVSPIFALELAAIVRDTDDEEGETPFDDADFDGGTKPPEKKRGDRKPDSADWWKRGEEPPF